jgi:glycosyltransferase involved in cell wall biosynthesis
MFYFGCDYLECITSLGTKTVVITRSGVLGKEDFPEGYTVVSLSFLAYFFYIVKARFRGWGIFSPTVHAVPFYPKQISILHDCYPFVEQGNRFKRIVLISMLFLGRGYIGGINRSSVLPFLRRRGFRKIFYCPNKVTELSSDKLADDLASSLSDDCPLRVGLVGTDSPKKRYELIVDSLTSEMKRFEFVVFGTDTAYYREIAAKFASRGFSCCRIDSSAVDLDFYLENSIDVLLSVAKGEGFCRPVAQAALANVPVFLLKDPVFVEFYCDTAVIKDSLPRLLYALQCQSDWVVGSGLRKAARNLLSGNCKAFSSSSTFIRSFLS